MDDTITVLAIVRDVAFISLLLLAALVGYLLYRRVASFLHSTRRTIETTGELFSMVTDRFRERPAERQGLASRLRGFASSIADRDRGGERES